MNLRKKLAFWKPRQNGDGAGAVFDFNNEQQNLYLSFIPQKGEKNFDYQSRINAKLNQSDLGEMLVVLRGRRAGMGKEQDGKFSGLFHRSGNGKDNSVIQLTQIENRPGYYFGLSVSRDGNQTRYTIGLSEGESEQMRVFLESVLTEMFIDYSQKGQNTTRTNSEKESVNDDFDEDTSVPF